jgi:hypothetical protein
MKTNLQRILIISVLLSLVFGGIYGCQSFKDYLSTNKDTLKEVVKGLVGEIVDQIFKELIDTQKIKTTFDKSITRSQLYNITDETKIYTPEQLAELKVKLTARIRAAIDSKEINVNDYISK